MRMRMKGRGRIRGYNEIMRGYNENDREIKQ